MIWDQSASIIVCLTKPNENGVFKCSQYWPTHGSVIYERFEINLVSEHVWCDDYLVRSFYLKNMVTNETRTVTQFHYITWMENDLPGNIKSLLDFRR
jgi:receptor-type tyrosine-protein phosphatase N